MKKNLFLVFIAALFFGTTKQVLAQSLCPDGLNHVSVNTVTAIFGNEIQWSIFGADGQVFLSSSTYQNNGSYFNTECLPDGCYTVHLHDTFGDGWNGGSMSITVDSVVMFSGTLGTGSDLMFALAINTSDCTSASVVYGCMDPNAANYNVAAIASDGSCLYAGCTDPSAINFNPNAGVLDSSCVYCNNGTNAHLYLCTFSNGSEVSLNIVDSNNVVVFTSPLMNNVAIYNTDICLDPEMCYTAIMTNNAGNQSWYNGYFWINVGGVQIIHESLDPTLTIEMEDFSVNGSCGNVITYGCTDASASNFDSNADINDGSCVYPVYGCTQMNALNYNPDAMNDDGSCIMPDVCGSMNLLFFDWTGDVFANESSIALYDNNGNYAAYSFGSSDSYACLNDGCYYTDLADFFGDGWGGTTLNIYLNGNPTAFATPYLNFGSSDSMMLSINTLDCQMTILGCTDVSAMNYNAIANIDDGSCVFSENCQYGWSYIQTMTGFWADEMSYSILASNGDVVFEFEGELNNTNSVDFACLAPDCYTIQMEDSWGDGWNGGYVFISNSLGYGDFYGSLNWGSEQAGMYSILSNCGTAIMGCMDSTALNYNASATEDDGTCMYNDNNPQGENPGMVLLETTVKLFPNPVADVLNVFMTMDNLSDISSVHYSIHAVDGKRIEQGQWIGSSVGHSLNVQHLAAGIYYLEVSDNENRWVKRFVKQ
jgi:hypothetical protein